MKNTAENDYTSLIALEAMIESSMKTIRGKRVMLCTDVAKLYQVSPDYLYKQVTKNITRFPDDFMFELEPEELALFKEDIFPFVFTEQGIMMVGGVLKSKQARKIHVQMIRYFVQLFNQVLNDTSLLEKLEPSVFSRFFKSKTNMTPQQFRQT